MWDLPTFKLVDPPCSRSKNTTTSVTSSFSFLSTSAVSRTLAPLEMTRFFQYPIFLISVLAEGQGRNFYLSIKKERNFAPWLQVVSFLSNKFDQIIIIKSYSSKHFSEIIFIKSYIKSFFWNHVHQITYQINFIRSNFSISFTRFLIIIKHKLFYLLSSKCTSIQKI